MTSTLSESHTQRSVLAVGYVVLDVLIHQKGIGHSAGGTAGNVAANLSYFGWASSVGALYGDDPAGDHLKADLARAGVSPRALMRREELSTPVVIHEVKNGAHRFKFGCPECGRKFSQFRAISRDFAEELSEESTPDVLFLDRVSSAAVLLAKSVRDLGGLVFFEPSMPADSPRFRELLDLAHVVKFSTERLDPKSHLLEDVDAIQIYTDGVNGAFWRRPDGDWKHVSGYSANVVDAGGAGDWTTAALLTALPSVDPLRLLSTDLTEPLKYAQAVAALSCQVLGARGLSSATNRDDLDERVTEVRRKPKQRHSTRTSRPTKSRRAAACSACLARKSACDG